MSMYLPNPALQPTGSEPGEYLEAPGLSRPAGVPAARRLDRQTRLDITRWAREYIAGVVEAHDGGPDDVRSIICEFLDEEPLVERTERLGDGPVTPRWA